MVEGPGCKVKGETLKPRVVGQIVRTVEGNAVDRHKKKSTKKKGLESDQSGGRVSFGNPFDELLGAKCSDIQTLGKEFFMFFEGLQNCLRTDGFISGSGLHFLMAGGFRVNGQKLDHEGDSEAQTHTIVLYFNKDMVSFHKSAAEMRPAADCLQKVKQLQSLDICASCFSHQRATSLVAEQHGRMVCDVLLDQLMLPGVGNIIKNEALFDSGVHPDTKIERLTLEHVSHLVKMTRDFSMVFYKCRKEGKSLHPYLKIYRKGQCKQCDSKTTTTRMGDDSVRLTTFCSNCQTNDVNKLKQWKLPVKNSLLGWIAAKKTEIPQPDWTCSLCTLVNSYKRTNCEACLGARNPEIAQARLQTLEQKISAICPSLPSMPLEEYPSLPSLQPGRKTHRSGINATQVTSTPDRKRGLSANETLEEAQSPLPQNTSVLHASFDMDISFEAVTSPPHKRLKSSQQLSASHSTQSPNNSNSTPLHSSQNFSQNSLSSQSQKSKSGVPSSQTMNGVIPIVLPVCPKHKKTPTMREVRKESQNKGRMFYSCGARNCDFFKWADESFPICEGHGKRCAIRTVMKQGNNNGRRFFACPLGKQKTCQYFQWADQYNEVTIR